ncbi:MAG: hypothetical protein LUH63_05230 [Parabacteroides sp.]|nr:hypothetical protein [Parabacteroides sp.]
MIYVYILENNDNGYRLIGHTEDLSELTKKLQNISGLLSASYKIVYRRELKNITEAMAYKKQLQLLPYEVVSVIIQTVHSARQQSAYPQRDLLPNPAYISKNKPKDIG